MIDEEPEAIEETINEAVRQAFVNIFTAETQSEEQ
jgi:hypothetical protein